MLRRVLCFPPNVPTSEPDAPACEPETLCDRDASDVSAQYTAITTTTIEKHRTIMEKFIEAAYDDLQEKFRRTLTPDLVGWYMNNAKKLEVSVKHKLIHSNDEWTNSQCCSEWFLDSLHAKLLATYKPKGYHVSTHFEPSSLYRIDIRVVFMIE